MDKPEDIPSDVWDYVLFAVMPRDLIGSTIGNMVLQNTCRAILSAQSQAYIDAARIEEKDDGAGVNNEIWWVVKWTKGAIIQERLSGPYTEIEDARRAAHQEVHQQPEGVTIGICSSCAPTEGRVGG